MIDLPVEAKVPVIVLVASLGPAVIASGLWLLRRPNLAERGGLALASAWNLVGLLAVNAIAIDQGWWSYQPGAPLVLGTPAPLLVGWTILWGVAAPLAGRGVLVTTAALGALDLLVMPLLEPAVALGPRWLLGEAVLLAVVAGPAVGLARSQAQRSTATLTIRVWGQVALFTVTLLWAIPAVARGQAGGPAVSPWLFGAVVGSFGLAALPGAISVVEFRLHGGTPWPWDRTRQPIRSGPYRFSRSPMQASGVLVLLLSAGLYRSWSVLAAAAVAGTWALVLCHAETPRLAEQWGPAWTDLALGQRRWLPTLRPHPGGERAELWVDLGCQSCRRSVLPWLGAAPVALTVRDAADHPDRLYRLHYERADGVAFDGIAAFGAALEHTNLGLALVGWFLRLPGVAWAVQQVSDGVGFGPRPVSQEPVGR